MLSFVVLMLAMQIQPSGQFTRCMKRADAVSVDMLACGHAEIARVDARLNTAYRRLMATLPLRQRNDLRVEQRTWLHHHVRETRRLADDPDNGSMAFIESQRFEIQDLGDRTIVLEQRLAARR